MISIPRRFILIIHGLCSCLLVASAQEERGTDILKGEVMEMGLSGVGAELSAILEQYYHASHGGIYEWSKIQSFRAEGVLRMADGAIRFVAFKKKPNYCKIVVLGRQGPMYIGSYDGSETWQLLPLEADTPVPMPELEARDFIRDAGIGNHLLFANLEGKQLELGAIEEVEGVRCRNITVVLPDGQELCYSLSLEDYSLRRQIVRNSLSGQQEVTLYSDIRKISGVRVAFTSELYVEGELRHTVVFNRVEFNVGAMPWMFSTPSGAYMPGGLNIPAQNSQGVHQEGFGGLVPQAEEVSDGWGFQFDRAE